MTNIFSEIVAHFGGQLATARALGVSQGTVSGWTRGLHGCSAETAFHIQGKTGGRFNAAQLRPSLAESLPTMNETVLASGSADQTFNHAGILTSTLEATT